MRTVLRTKRKTSSSQKKSYTFPLVIERDEDGFFVVECPAFEGCYTQGKTFDEAMQNIGEVLQLALGEKENQNLLKNYNYKNFTFTTITL